MVSSLEGKEEGVEVKRLKLLLLMCGVGILVLSVFFCISLMISLGSGHQNTPESWDVYWQGVIAVFVLGASVGMVLHGLPFQFKVIHKGNDVRINDINLDDVE